MVGALVHGLGVEPKRIHTYSEEGGGEGHLLKNFRAFHHLNPTHCHTLKHTDSSHEEASDLIQQKLSIFGAPPQQGGNPKVCFLLSQQRCSVLFSGFGGDQAISHNAANVISDLVEQGRWKELKKWVGSKRQLVKQTLARSVILRQRRLAERIVLKRSQSFRSSEPLPAVLLERPAVVGAYLNKTYPWELDGFARQHESIRRRVLADWVAVRAEDETRLAAFYGMDKDFPLLDEKLISTLLHQDPSLFGEAAGRGRLVHRKAFAPFLPPYLRDNPTKNREPEGGLEEWQWSVIRKQKQMLEENALTSIKTLHPGLTVYWDIEEIRRETDDVLLSHEPNMRKLMDIRHAIFTLSTLSAWWKVLDR